MGTNNNDHIVRLLEALLREAGRTNHLLEALRITATKAPEDLRRELARINRSGGIDYSQV